jgi:hypothetical protein
MKRNGVLVTDRMHIGQPLELKRDMKMLMSGKAGAEAAFNFSRGPGAGDDGDDG